MLEKAANTGQPIFETNETTGLASWRPIALREFLERREGQIWRHEDTLELLKRAEEIDTLIEQIIRRAGLGVK